jgi:uncharacterized surface protein with fasciclin (FAS1) repeats
MGRIYLSLFVIGLALSGLSSAGPVDHAKTRRRLADKATVERTAAQADIVDTAVGAGNFKTLVAAVKAAGLVDALKGPGPLTVFAPTDEAFAKLPKDALQSLLKPENRDKLVKILTYHVTPGQLKAQDVTALSGAKTLQGGLLKFRAAGGAVQINNAHVVKADIAASNGVIHVIDTVLTPK